MGLRITTWNVNGIRNPFGYQPWRDKKTFAAMFDTLNADIVVMQETKIQRKDLQDDMVLVPGWDVFFSLPKHKKGYSGVAIYTRNAVCAPIRAEEGITGVLTPPGSSTSFCDLPEDQQIGGYPKATQFESMDAATLDSEGRCVILEFPAFVLLGVYCPTRRNDARDEFRLGFLNALDVRVRNLVAAGKRVFLTGDLNISRDEIDTANMEEQLRKNGMTVQDYLSMPARRIFNQLLLNGNIVGDRDEGREEPVLIDLCRSFHPDRKGMFTCWETKINARPGNFGSRIDYVLCSLDMRDWFCEADIQEGLLGSDHCPVYAVIKDTININHVLVDIKDVMNPDGMFKEGLRLREWAMKDLLPISARLIPEFDRRRNIRDMFAKPSTKSNPTKSDGCGTPKRAEVELQIAGKDPTPTQLTTPIDGSSLPDSSLNTTDNIQSKTSKRPADSSTSRSLKRSKSNGLKSVSKGQSSLVGFFRPKTALSNSTAAGAEEVPPQTAIDSTISSTLDTTSSHDATASQAHQDKGSILPGSPSMPFQAEDQNVVDPIVAKESWSKLLSKRVVPRCEHNEPCISYVTRKPGVNCGRSFYTCARPLGPSGVKEKGTQWRCGTFIWSSDWTVDNS